MKNKKYYLGLDIGSDSVGYAVTDEEYNLLKLHGEPAWGATLFDAPASKPKGEVTVPRDADSSAASKGFSSCASCLPKR